MESCKGCGIAFEKQGRKRYCSRTCRQRVYESLRMVRPAADVCLQCKQPIGIRPGGRRRQFCSDPCRMAFWRSRHQTTVITCDQCGKTARRPPSGVAHAARNHFCSPTCKGKWMSANLIGARASNWKGDSPGFIIEYIRSRLHAHPRWKAWAAAVRANAGDKCERCGNPAEESHHKREIAELLSLVLDPSNGEALCRNCHRAHHRV